MHFIRQGLDLLRSLDAGLYGPTRAIDGRRSPVGAHVRHVVDYYRCFLRGLADGRVDYDARERDPALEQDPRVAEAVLLDLVAAFEGLADADPRRGLEVRVDACGQDVWHRSSLGREFQFLASHTVHHYALIALLLRDLGIDPGEDFGVAPSTLAYQKAAVVAAT